MKSQEESKEITGTQGIDPVLKARAIESIQEYTSKKKDIVAPFMERVPEAMARDYRDHITAEMWINLVESRL